MNDRIQPEPSSTAIAVTDSTKTRRTLLIAWFMFLVLSVATVLATRASAQAAVAQPNPAAPAAAGKYDVMTLNPQFLDPAIKQKMERAAKALVTARDLNGFADLPYAKGYIDTYLPAKITQPDSLGEISPLINEVMQNYARCQKAGNPGAMKMVEWLFRGMGPVAQGNYQPAARINATLVLGKLDIRAATGETPPVPLKYSFPILLTLYQNPANPDGVRAAALQGLHRMALYGAGLLTQPERDALVAEMKKLLDEPVPENRSAKAHAFLQRYAVDVLDLLSAPNDKTLATQLVGISTNSEIPDLIALHSAARFGSMGQLKGSVPAAAIVLESWSKRALKAFEAELNRLNALDHPLPASEQPPDPETMVVTKPAVASGMGMGGMGEMDMGGMGSMDSGMGGYSEMDMGGGMEGYDDMGMGMMGMGMGMMAPAANPQPPEVIASRRKLNHVLEQLQVGVSGSSVAGEPKTAGGLLTAVPDAEKKLVSDWIATIGSVIQGLNELTLDDRTKYKEGLEAQIVVLQGLAGVEAKKADADAGPVMPPVFGFDDPAAPVSDN